MMAGDAEQRQSEIIIVRRGSEDEDEGHHGGVWKIAFADFMTAMMCFFLVMWLINAANEETRVALASYFNPVKLIDRNTSRKGLEDLGETPTKPGDAETPDETSDPALFPHSANLTDTREYSDEYFFSAPYAVLAEIAAQTGTNQNISVKGEGGEQIAGPSSGASGGEAYRDPFAPDFWSQQVAEPQIGVEGDPDKAREQPAGADAQALETGEHELADTESDATARAREKTEEHNAAALKPVPQQVEAPAQGAGETPRETPAEDAAPGQAAANAVTASGDKKSPEADQKPASPPEQSGEMQEKVAEELRTALAKALDGEGLANSVTVSVGDEGIMISIVDDIPSGMFAVGSAVPERALVLAMEKIGRALAERKGDIRIYGHTDARPFRGGGYDNWRLSTARAHAAQYMLVRGGLDEIRIKEVAGFADRRLKVPDNPLADANRRIEILLEPLQ